jgi:predicted nucleic acid-binding protein
VGESYFLDANILMYAAGAEHALKQPCQRALERAVDAAVYLLTDAEVLQEILHRYFSLGRPDAARTVYQSAIQVCDEVLPITERETSRALELLEKHAALSPRDALHVATMESAQVTRLLSTDRDFDRLPRVQRVAPGDFLR